MTVFNMRAVTLVLKAKAQVVKGGFHLSRSSQRERDMP
jgi:hypothetical protein